MIDQAVLQDTLAVALRRGGEFAEIFIEDKQSSGALFDDQKIEELSSGRSRGAGIRVIVGDTTGFAHTADLSPAGLTTAANAAADAARDGNGTTTTVALQSHAVTPHSVRVYPNQVEKARKVELLVAANDIARSASDSIHQVSVGYADVVRKIQIANSNGLLIGDEQVKTRFSVSCVANGDSGMHTGRQSIGHSYGFELFDAYDIADVAKNAARRALLKLKARPAPSGTLPVVIACGGGGVLFHEACGHGLEADLVMKKASVYADRVGEQVASPLVTVIDDGTMVGEWGCFSIDDEGNTASRNVLIKDGVLMDYMWDSVRANKKQRSSSGNGRRQNYKYLPMVRMTNTFVENGDTDPQDIISSTEKGVYVAQLQGGQVNTASGDFVFGMSEAYLIEDGEITEPIRDGNLIGNGPEVLSSIDALGNDFKMGSPGMCGKDGQGVPVGDGTPTLRVPALTVGGTAQ